MDRRADFGAGIFACGDCTVTPLSRSSPLAGTEPLHGQLAQLNVEDIKGTA